MSFLLIKTYGKVARYQLLLRHRDPDSNILIRSGARPNSAVCDYFFSASKLLVGLLGSTCWKRIGPDLHVADVVFVLFV